MSLGLRVTADIKRRLDSAAEKNGRSQSQEAELRLERSFKDEDLLSNVLEIAYGPQLAGMLLSIGWAMEDVGRGAAFTRAGTLEAVDNWFNDPYAFDQAAKAAATILLSAQPKGDPSPPVFKDARLTDHARLRGQSFGGSVVDSIQGRTATKQEETRAGPIRALLGPIAKRLKRPGGEVKIMEKN